MKQRKKASGGIFSCASDRNTFCHCVKSCLCWLQNCLNLIFTIIFFRIWRVGDRACSMYSITHIVDFYIVNNWVMCFRLFYFSQITVQAQHIISNEPFFGNMFEFSMKHRNHYFSAFCMYHHYSLQINWGQIFGCWFEKILKYAHTGRRKIILKEQRNPRFSLLYYQYFFSVEFHRNKCVGSRHFHSTTLQ